MISESNTKRFLAKFRKGKPGSCWNWKAATNNYGYGMMYLKRENKSCIMVLARRYAFELWKGAVKEGYGLAASCDNRLCVNPNHLEQHPKEALVGLAAERRTQFKCGHSIEGNALKVGSKKVRVCKKCHDDALKGSNKDKTHCPAGHKYTLSSTYFRKDRPAGTGRMCKICIRLKGKARWQREKKAAK